MQCGALYTHPRRNARSRSKQNIHNAHNVTARNLLSKFAGRQKRRLVQHVGEEPAALEEAVAASVEWIRVCIANNYFCRIMMQWISETNNDFCPIMMQWISETNNEFCPIMMQWISETNNELCPIMMRCVSDFCFVV